MSTYCPRIHHGLTLQKIKNHLLTYSACCWSDQTIVMQDQIDWQHPDLVKLREQNHAGELSESYCAFCINLEKSGQQSMRKGYEIIHGEPTYDNTLQYLDISIDSTCNLACVTCGPVASTTWRNELKLKNLSRLKMPAFLDRFDRLDFSHLKEIRLWGGEPFLTTTHRDILNYISQKVDVSKIRLMYNTNGTCKIDDDTKSLIERYQFARISFSIDAIGPRFDYIRYPGRWPEVEDTLLWWRENLPHNSMLSMTVTASMLNVLSLNEVYDWQQQHWRESRYGDPTEIFVHNAWGVLCLENMPRGMAQELRAIPNYCQPWIQNMDGLAKNPDGPKQALEYLQNLDQRRGLQFGDVLPELSRWLNPQ